MDTVVQSMKSIHFNVNGADRTYWDFFVKDPPGGPRRSESLTGSARLPSIRLEGEGSVHDTLAVAANSLGVRYPSELCGRCSL